MPRSRTQLYDQQTPQQRKIAERQRRALDARRRTQCTTLGFWRLCGKAACRRKRGCTGDMHACFDRHWRMVPEEMKAYVRGCVLAARHTRSMAEIDRAGRAARAEYRKRVAELAALRAPAPVQPERAHPLPAPNIRRL